MFENFPQSEIKIVAPDGTVRSIERGIVDSKQITIPNRAAVIHAGDEIHRTLPNGIEERFEVIEPTYHNQFHGIPAHFQVKIRRKGTGTPLGKPGGNITFNVSGANARVNFGSHDQSRNVISGDNVFFELRHKIQEELPDTAERSRLLGLVESMEKNRNDRSAYTSAYQSFIGAAANHMTLIAPFIPAITQLLS